MYVTSPLKGSNKSRYQRGIVTVRREDSSPTYINQQTLYILHHPVARIMCSCSTYSRQDSSQTILKTVNQQILYCKFILNFPLLTVKRADSNFERGPIVNLNRLLLHLDFLTYDQWLMYIQFRGIITLPIYMKSERFLAFVSKIEPAFRCLLGMWEVYSCIKEILEQ